MSQTYFITGAARGLGFETVVQLLADKPEAKIIATVRKLSTAGPLKALVEENKERLVAIELDVTDEASVKTGAAETAAHPFAASGIDVLINNAGILAGGWDSATKTTVATLEDNFRANVVGPIIVTLALLPLLKKGTAKQVFTVGSTVGSIGGPFSLTANATSYAVSKAAVHMYMKKLSSELGPEGFTIISFHPGYVQTDMNNGASGGAELTTPVAVSSFLKNVIFAVTPKDNGTLWSYTGEKVPW